MVPQETRYFRIPITGAAYVNVSEGHPNVNLIIREQNFRIIVGDLVQPPFDTDDYLKIAGRSDGRSVLVTIIDLDANSAVWVRNEADDEESDLRVMRGVAKIGIFTL